MKKMSEEVKRRIAEKTRELYSSLDKIRLAESFPVKGGDFVSSRRGDWFSEKKPLRSTLNRS